MPIASMICNPNLNPNPNDNTTLFTITQLNSTPQVITDAGVKHL